MRLEILGYSEQWAGNLAKMVVMMVVIVPVESYDYQQNKGEAAETTITVKGYRTRIPNQDTEPGFYRREE